MSKQAQHQVSFELKDPTKAVDVTVRGRDLVTGRFMSETFPMAPMSDFLVAHFGVKNDPPKE